MNDLGIALMIVSAYLIISMIVNRTIWRRGWKKLNENNIEEHKCE